MSADSSKPQDDASATIQTNEPALFRPFKLGDLNLEHRIVHAPLTRYKADKTHIQLSLVKEYYIQRSSTPGTLIISEATFVAHRAGINPHCPGIYTIEQARVWREITDAVHARHCFMFCQIWGLGRSAASREEDPSWEYVSASPIRLSTKGETPRALTIPEIKEYVSHFGDAAALAVSGAGFDGVELHFANGYLVDQFLQDVSNHRTDAYGGSIEGRTRFALEIIDEVVTRVGPKKVGVRVSPWSPFQDMRMKDPIPTFSYLVNKIKEKHPDIAFMHVVEPRISGSADAEDALVGKDDSNDFIREIWATRPLISAGRYSRETAIQTANDKGDLIAFGRYFVSNVSTPETCKSIGGASTTEQPSTCAETRAAVDTQTTHSQASSRPSKSLGEKTKHEYLLHNISRSYSNTSNGKNRTRGERMTTV